MISLRAVLTRLRTPVSPYTNRSPYRIQCNSGLPIGYSVIVALTGLPIALTGLPIGYSVIVALTGLPKLKYMLYYF